MAAITDLFTATENGGAPQPTTCATARVSGATTLECEAITNWPTTGATGANTAVYFITAPTTTNSAGLTVLDNTKLMSWKGIVSGNELTDITLIWSAAGDDIGNSVGDIVQMAPTSSWAQGLFSGLTTTVFNTDGSLQDNIIGTDQIQDGAVTTSTLAASAVTNAEIASATITGSNIASSTVTAGNLVGISLYGVGGAQKGTPPARLTGQFYIQSGSTAGTPASGSFAITFPETFPNGVLDVVVSYGDDTYVTYPVVVVNSDITTSSFVVYASGSGSTAYRVNWIAIGW